MTKTETKIVVPAKAVQSDPLAWVSPGELCQQQTKALASDSFTAFAAHGF